ncbi:MAG: hypothetical protein AAFY71_16325 [Bacteroidota bacterium]
MTNDLFYQPSGKVPILGATIAAAGTILAAVIIGYIYAHAIIYIPFIYILFFLTIGAGWIMGQLPEYLIKFGKIRHKAAGVALGIFGGLALLYVHWAIWVAAIYAQSEGGSMADPTVALNFALAPGALWETMVAINKIGTWELGGVINGTFLWVIWAIEAIVMVGLSTLNGLGTDPIPFDEDSDAWSVKLEIPSRYQIVTEIQSLFQELNSGNWEIFKSLVPQTNPDRHYTRLTMYHAVDTDKYFISATNMILSISDKGEAEWDEQDLFLHYKLNSSQGRALIEHFNNPPAPEPEQTDAAGEPSNPSTPDFSEFES